MSERIDRNFIEITKRLQEIFDKLSELEKRVEEMTHPVLHYTLPENPIFIEPYVQPSAPPYGPFWSPYTSGTTTESGLPIFFDGSNRATFYNA